MLTTRYWGKLIDPRPYKAGGFGFRGWWLNLLNRIRITIEQRVAVHILVLECRRQGVKAAEIKQIVAQAKADPHFVVPEPKRPIFERIGLKGKMETLCQSTEQRTRSRYEHGRVTSDENQLHRPISLEDGMRVTFAVEAEKHDRSARYVASRHQRRIVVDEDTFTPTVKHDPDLK